MNGVKLELLKLALTSHLSKSSSEPVDEHDMTFVCEAAIDLLREREKFVELRDELTYLSSATAREVVDKMTVILEDATVLEVWEV